MKIRVETDGNLTEDEIIIRCGRVDDSIMELHKMLLTQISSESRLTFYKGNQEYYFPADAVLFFETEGEHVYAHTADDMFRISYRLYELEEILPPFFCRISKSAIVNTKQIYSLTRGLTTSSLIQFSGSKKTLYVSRRYTQDLRLRLYERSQL